MCYACKIICYRPTKLKKLIMSSFKNCLFVQDLAPTDPLLLISTLDGTLHAVSKRTGIVKWKLDEDPVLNVPMESTTTIKG